MTPKVKNKKHRSHRKDWDATELRSCHARSAYVYVLQNDKHKVYTGATMGLSTRLQSHNAGRVASTRAGRPWHFAATIGPFANMTAATRFESLVKSSRGGVDAKIRKARGAIAGRTDIFIKSHLA